MSRQEGAQPLVVDGVRPCVGKLQVVSRHPWMLAAFATLQVSEHHSNSTLLLCGDSRCWLVSRTSSTPSYLDSTDSGASQQGWSGTGIRADS